MAKTAKDEAKGKKKRGNKKAINRVAMKHQSSKPNPFESLWSHRKFDILGKKRKGEERRTGLARSLAIEKRKKTLLKEYQQSNKSSVFLDKRIGEQNDELGEFDKAIMRAQRERQLKGKKNKYNLSDGEEEEFDIPGIGPLSERDDFEEGMLSDDDKNGDADEGEAEGKFAILKQLNSHDMQNALDNNLLEGEERKDKSKKEIMEEVILKSKYFKAQKAKDKEENEHLMEELDESFTSLVQSQLLSSLTEPGKMRTLKALVNKPVPNDHSNENELPVTNKAATNKKEQLDSYDKLVIEMALDIRARPSDRTKTPEEIAQEERERLEQLEEERQKRMQPNDDSGDEDGDNVKKDAADGSRSISGDALGDSFSIDEEPVTRRGWVDEVLERKDLVDPENEYDEDDSEDSESGEVDGGGGDDNDDDSSEEDDGSEDGGEHERSLSLKDWEQSDDENLGQDFEDDEDELEHDEAVNDKKTERRSQKASNDAEISKENAECLNVQKMQACAKTPLAQSDIPFIIEAPKCMEELSVLLENRSNEDIILIVNRIRVSNAIKLAADNRKKMQVFYGVLLQYFAILANMKPLNFELLNLLVKPLMEMSTEIPYFAAICARHRILHTRTQFAEVIKSPEVGCWPNLKTLLLLRLWSMIFPCSDFRHVVMTPAILLMCEYLMRCPIRTGRDIIVGSFLCSMVLVIVKQSQKFCPEAIIFLRTLLMAASESNQTSDLDCQFYQLMELKALRPLLHIRDSWSEIKPINFLMVMDMPDDSPFFSSDYFRASAVATMLETLRGFVDIYHKLSSFTEIFLPIGALLLQLSQQENMPESLRLKFKDVALVINKKADEIHALRRPLQMRKQKPVPIKTVVPKVEENYVKGRDYDPDRERAETRKLKKLLKREAKGAARELRKDNYFLHEVKQREKELLNEERAEKFRAGRHFLEEQEHAYKSGQLGKGRKRRR